MDDRLDLARAVEVFDPEDHYQDQLHRIDERERAHRVRLTNRAVGVLLCCLLGAYIVFTYTIGAHA